MTTVASAIALTKNIIGAGMLALPAGMAAGKGTGQLPAVLLVIVSCLLSTYSFTLVGRVVEVTGAVDFRELWGLTVGSASAGSVDTMILGVASGTLLVYSCFLGDILASLLGGAMGRTSAILSASAVLVPLILLPDLSALAPMAYAGVAAVAYSAFFIIRRFLDGSCVVSADALDSAMGSAMGSAFGAVLPVAPQLGQVSAWRLSLGTCVLFNMLSTAYMAHTNAVRFYNELEGRTPPKFAAVVVGGFATSAALYAAVMLAGYRTFGAASQGLILNNYATGDRLAKVARAATGISILGSYPLLFTSLRDVVVSTLKSSAAFASLGEACGAVSSVAWRVLSLSMLGLLTLLAVLTTDVGFAVSLCGSLFGAALIFCVPTLIFLSAKKADDKSNPALPTSKAEMAGVHLLFAFGVLAAVFGTVVTFLETFTDLLA